jgi:hypothetical protein
MKIFSRIWVAATVAAIALPSVASAQTWTDWTSGTPGVNVLGTLTIGGFSTGVTVTGDFSGYQLSSGVETGTWGQPMQQYWTPNAAFSQGGVTAPTGYGMIQTDRNGTATITFGGFGAINPFFAINSLGRANVGGAVSTSVTFSGAGATLLSSNNGGAASYWGGGTCSMVGQTLTGSECSGVVRLTGTYTSITLTSNLPNEYWDGFTVGAETLTPEPSTYVLFAAGLMALGVVSRRRRSV